MIVDNSPKTREQVQGPFAWVDVRDAALGHVLALEKIEAGGERIITSEGTSAFSVCFQLGTNRHNFSARTLCLARLE